MKFGMTGDQLKQLERLIVQPLKSQGAEVFIFGSRVTGNHHPYSDVDLLFRSEKELPSGFIAQLLESAEESSFPFKIDLVDEKNIAISYRDSVSKQKQPLT